MRVECSGNRYAFWLQQRPSADNPLQEVEVLEHMPLEGIITGSDCHSGKRAYLRIGQLGRDLMVNDVEGGREFVISPDIYWCFKNYGIAAADCSLYQAVIIKER